MPRVITAPLDARDLDLALVAARFNEFVTERLVAGAVDAFVRHGGDEARVTVVWAPGSFELPLVARKLAESKAYHAVVCVGCVVRGQTPHFDYVAGEAARGIAQAAQQTGVPVAFGLITADTMEQAIDRAGGKAGNKGADAVLAAIEMANLLPRLAHG